MKAIDPVIGVWDLNLAKSRFINEPTPFSYRAATRTYRQDADGIFSIVHAILPDGTEFTEGMPSYKTDGKFYEHTGNALIDTMSVERIDDYTMVLTTKKGDKVVGAGTRTISHDGKLLTMTFIYIDSDGIMRGHVAAYDKRERNAKRTKGDGPHRP